MMRTLRETLALVPVALGWMVFAYPAAADLAFSFTSGIDVAVTAPAYTADGELNLTLGFEPTPGTHLTVVKITGPAFIAGTFSNAIQGATVPLTYNGITYNYIVNYYGGNGRSLVLQWPLMGMAAWGTNAYGQLGNNGISNQSAPVSVTTRGQMAGKTVTRLAAGQFHSLALTADGHLFSWGNNSSGQLGNNSTQKTRVPVDVDASGVLAGKVLVAVAAGNDHSLAIASDGMAYAWGFNNSGQLGSGNLTQSLVPVAVNTSGGLTGKALVAVAAGNGHSLALSSEGLVYSWGSNAYGALGHTSLGNGSIPVAVDTSGVLASKTIVAISGGNFFSLALSSDGQVFSWGYNGFGQLGNNSTTSSTAPVIVNTSGELSGKSVVAVAAGYAHSLALTADGKVFAWGENGSGQLGNSSTSRSPVPVAVNTSGAMVGKTVVAIAAGQDHSVAITLDGMIFTWGTIDTIHSSVPVAVTTSGAPPGRLVSSIVAGWGHNMALLDLGPPSVTRHPVSQTAAAGATVAFTATAGNEFPSTVQWQVSPTGTAGTFSDIVDNASATTGTLTLANVMASQNGYAYQAVFSNSSGYRVTAMATLTLVDWTATITSGSDVPFQGVGVVASGPLNVQLGFAPAPGTHLTVVKNDGTSFIMGAFSNAPQGGTIPLTFNGVTYNYLANYYGGNGRSLVLQWPLIRMAAWGENRNGCLGNGTTTTSLLPVKALVGGALAGKTLVKVCAGSDFSLGLTSEGKLFAWGQGIDGQLGVNSQSSSSVPVEVTASGALAGKTIVSMAAGSSHALALTSDGQVFAWGVNGYGQVGIGSPDFRILSPVALGSAGVFDGKIVVAISAGGDHSMALTSEGRVFTWGMNYSGELGDGTSISYSRLPLEVMTSEELAGQTIVAIAAGLSHCLALAADGRLFAWGANGGGKLGINSTRDSHVPTAVIMSGALAGKTVTAITGGWHSLALTADNMLFAWGYNTYGELGNGTLSDSWVPVAVNQSGVLSGKTLSVIACGSYHSVVMNPAGNCYTWGQNTQGQLGNNSTTDSPLPVAVAASGEFAEMKAVAVAAGNTHNLVLLDSGPPTVTINPFNRMAASGATVTFTAAATDPFGYSVRWQVSTAGIAGPFADITDNPTATTETLTLTEISTSYDNHAYRAVFSNNSGFSITSPATLTLVNWAAIFNAASDIPFRADGVVASGSLNLQLGFAPMPGTNLTVVKNTGTAFITGTFSNVPQGTRVPLTYNGVTYDFIANYYGGNGRSLVLQWPWMGLAAWGLNSSGQLGNGSLSNSQVPVPLITSGALAGKAVITVAAGGANSLALTSDGQVWTWGGNNTAPVAVTTSGVLADKMVVTVAAGDDHNLALTSDGQVFAWGTNTFGQLGNNNTTSSMVPVAVMASGALAGKTVVAIAAGRYHSLALTSDGQVFAWGYNSNGQLGNRSTTSSAVPVVVSTEGVLAGLRVVAVAAGDQHNLALTTDGRVFAWGANFNGQLGNNSTASCSAPVAVHSSAALAGKTVTAIATGSFFSLALTSDGHVVAWGDNGYGQLGNGGTTKSLSPVAVNTCGTLANKLVIAIAGGVSSSIAFTSDAQVYAWGYNGTGLLGNNSSTDSPLPVAVNTSGTLSGKMVAAIAAGDYHCLAMFGLPGSPTVTLSPVSQTVVQTESSGVSISFTAAAIDVFPFTVQWQLSQTGSAGPFSDIIANPSTTTGTLTLTNVVPEQNGYAYRAVFANDGGSCATSAATLSVTTVNEAVTFTSGTDLPFVASNPVVSGSLNITLGFAPILGTNLTILKNTGTAFIRGTFSNLPQGAIVPLTANGVTLNYIANYYGGNGRSLVLQWPLIGVAAWGDNSNNQLGNNSSTSGPVPVPVISSGVLAGKTVVAVAAGANHSLALTADGQVFAWGANGSGQLGCNSLTGSAVPVAVYASGALSGKSVVAIAAGTNFSMALTADGQVFAWGANGSGQLGDNSMTNSPVPVAVNTGGAFSYRTVVAIAGGGSHALALASDGQVFAWGSNNSGQLGNGTTTANSLVPTAVSTSGLLAGKTVTAIAAGAYHSLGLTSNGQVIVWGYNYYGQLGNNSNTNSPLPVAADTSGVLAGKTISTIAAGASHSLALTSNGQVIVWGYNYYGQLGTNGTASSRVPIAMVDNGVLAGMTVAATSAGYYHSLALTSDGKMATWGSNSYGQLGDSSYSSMSTVPVAISTSGVLANKNVVAVAGGSYHSLAMFGSGWAPIVTTQPTNRTVAFTATVILSAAASGYPVPTVRWQVRKTATGSFSNLTGNSTATTTALTLTNVASTQNGYAYRAVFTNSETSATTAAAILTVYPPPAVSVPPDILVGATGKNGAVVAYSVTANDSLDGPLTPICTPPSGSTFPIGTTTVNCTASNSLGGTTSASFIVTVLRTYASFQEQYDLTDTDPAADPYFTGVSTLAAYAFGVAPAAPDRSQLPSVSLESGYLQISFPRWKDSADLGYIVEASDDLENWHSGPDTTQQVSVTAINATRERVVERDLIPVASAARRYMRVRINH